MTRKRVLITGALGMIGRKITPALQRKFDVSLIDVRSIDSQKADIAEFEHADLTAPDRDRYRHNFSGIDTVVHLAYVSDRYLPKPVDPDIRFRTEMLNIQMAYNVYRVSQEEGVRRVIFASSNHASDFHESLLLDGRLDTLQPHSRPLSKNFYGWSKASYEHLGFVFAVGAQLRARSSSSQTDFQGLEVIQIRIGRPKEIDISLYEGGSYRRLNRALAVYVSDRDLQEIVVKSIQAEDIANENDVPFQIFYGISDNSRAYWSIDNAKDVIDYRPKDNSELKFAEIIAKCNARERHK